MILPRSGRRSEEWDRNKGIGDTRRVRMGVAVYIDIREVRDLEDQNSLSGYEIGTTPFASWVGP